MSYLLNKKMFINEKFNLIPTIKHFSMERIVDDSKLDQLIILVHTNIDI